MRHLLLISLLGLLALPLTAHAIVIDNGIPIGTVGHFSVDVLTGGAIQNAVLTERAPSGVVVTKSVASSYRVLVDPGIDGQGFELQGSEPVVNFMSDSTQVSSAGTFIGANGNTIQWTAESSMSTGFPSIETGYLFTTDDNAAEPIGPLRIFQYLDGGIQGSNRDLFVTAGPITEENSLTPRLDFLDNIEFFGVLFAEQGGFNSTFVGSAVDRFNHIQDRIQGSGQPASIPTIVTGLPGFQFSYLRLRELVYGPANLTAVLASDVNPGAHSTGKAVSLEGFVLPPCERSDEETCGRPAVKPATDQFSCRTTGCAIPVTCKLTAPCKTRTKLLVTPESIRLKNDLAVKAQRRIKFATAVTNIPPGKTLTIRPKLTKQGKQLLRANRNRIIDGVMSIRNAATGDLFSSTPVKIRLK